MPKSLLGRTFLLLSALVLITTAAWLTLFRYLDAEPRARESAQLAASAVNLVRAALLAAAPAKRDSLFTELSSREGLRLLPAEAQDEVTPPPEERFYALVARSLRDMLGPHTRLAAAVDGVPGFWVSFRLDDDDDDDEEYWLILPPERADHPIARQWLIWALLALTLALGVAGTIANHLSQPLKALARSAATVGEGRHPAPLPETGTDELRELAHAFNRMAGDLRRNEEARSEILAGISHDLRTPLTRLRLEIELSIADEATREAMVADIGQMEAVIAQFMDYARGNAGETAQATDLGALLAELVDNEHRRGRPLAADIERLPLLVIRPRSLARAVGNLLDNAWKYGARAVALNARLVGHSLHLSITDDGPGIPAADLDRVRQAFTRGEAARSNAGGTGLGLAIVERVAADHEGHLEMANRAEGGLVATLVLPVRRAG